MEALGATRPIRAAARQSCREPQINARIAARLGALPSGGVTTNEPEPTRSQDHEFPFMELFNAEDAIENPGEPLECGGDRLFGVLGGIW
jgi:hypothetical protein